MTALLTGLAATVVVLTAAARIPRVVTELIRACIPLVTAIHDLRTALASDAPTDMRDKKPSCL